MTVKLSRKSLLKKLSVAATMVIGAVAAALFIAEALLRLFDYPVGVSERVTGYRQVDDQLIYALRPGFSSPEVRINRLGLRGPDPGAWACSRRRVLLLGDSMFGYNVADGDSFPSQLDQLNRAEHSGTSMINAGVTKKGSVPFFTMPV